MPLQDSRLHKGYCFRTILGRLNDVFVLRARQLMARDPEFPLGDRRCTGDKFDLNRGCVCCSENLREAMFESGLEVKRCCKEGMAIVALIM